MVNFKVVSNGEFALIKANSRVFYPNVDYNGVFDFSAVEYMDYRCVHVKKAHNGVIPCNSGGCSVNNGGECPYDSSKSCVSVCSVTGRCLSYKTGAVAKERCLSFDRVSLEKLDAIKIELKDRESDLHGDSDQAQWNVQCSRLAWAYHYLKTGQVKLAQDYYELIYEPFFL